MIFHPDSLHLVQRETAERADPAGQVIQLGIDLFFTLEEIAFLCSIAVAFGSPLPRGRQFVVHGLEGAAVIATDAMISVATSVIKISVFGLAGVVTAQVLAFAVLIGAISIPGAFLARAFVERMPVHIHTAILDVAVIAGGVVMISTALRQLL